MLSTPSQFHTFGEFFAFFVPSLTGVVAFWATVALNIPDFTRYAKGQREQMLGQALGLPTTMTFYSFIGIAVTSATVVLFGRAIWDPVEVLSRLGNPIAVVVAMLALLLATLNVNVAANVVSPSNDFSNLYPRKISFKLGGVITCFIGLLMQPWRWLSSHGSYVMGWLVGYSSFLGPIAGVMIADYYVLHKRIILADDLYQRGGVYEFSRGFNWRAIAALVAGVAVALSGLEIPALHGLYPYAWFVGFAVSFFIYLLLMRGSRAGANRNDRRLLSKNHCSRNFRTSRKTLKQHRVRKFSRKRILLARMIRGEKPRQIPRQLVTSSMPKRKRSQRRNLPALFQQSQISPHRNAAQHHDSARSQNFQCRAPKSGGNSQAPKAKACSQAAHSVESRPCKRSSAPGRLRDSSKWADWQIPRETAPCTESLPSDPR